MPTWILTLALVDSSVDRLARLGRRWWRLRRAVRAWLRQAVGSAGRGIVHWSAAYATTAIASGVSGVVAVVQGELGRAPFPVLQLLTLSALTGAAALLCGLAALLAYLADRGRC